MTFSSRSPRGKLHLSTSQIPLGFRVAGSVAPRIEHRHPRGSGGSVSSQAGRGKAASVRRRPSPGIEASPRPPSLAAGVTAPLPIPRILGAAGHPDAKGWGGGGDSGKSGAADNGRGGGRPAAAGTAGRCALQSARAPSPPAAPSAPVPLLGPPPPLRGALI